MFYAVLNKELDDYIFTHEILLQFQSRFGYKVSQYHRYYSPEIGCLLSTCILNTNLFLHRLHVDLNIALLL